LEQLQTDWPSHHPFGTVILHQIIGGTECPVYLGNFGRERIVAKLSNGNDQLLDDEFKAYHTLRDLQGRSIPYCYGLFMIQDHGHILLLSYEGISLGSFQDLTSKQR
jgi:hypothetical protein